MTHRKKISILAVLLIVGNVLTELQGWLPDWLRDKRVDNLFIKPGFELKISFAWWLKILMDDLNTIIIFFVLAMVVRYFSRTLFYIVFVFVIYHVIDAFLLIWDFKQTKEIYWVMLLASGVSIFFLLNNRKMKKVK